MLYQFEAYSTTTGGAFVGGNGSNWHETLYSWDHRNRLTAVTERDANGRTTKEVEYTYDVFDRRIAKDVDEDGDGTIDRGERYVYDGEDIALVFDGAGSLENRYLHGPGIDEVFADEDALGEFLWGLTDNLGTVRDVVKYDAGTGTTSVVNHLKYDAFGTITSQSNAAYDPRFTYTGREWDADAGAYYYRTRWYGPDVGQFWSEDWIGFAAGDPNLRRYVLNSPATFRDPWGFDIWVEGATMTAEPGLHQSIGIGDPLGEYVSYSYGTDFLPASLGNIYQDPHLGGPIDPDRYLRTSPEADQALIRAIEHAMQIPGKGLYWPGHTCRDFSSFVFELAKSRFCERKLAEPASPPSRPIRYKLSTEGAPIGVSSTTTSTSDAARSVVSSPTTTTQEIRQPAVQPRYPAPSVKDIYGF